MKMIGNIKGIDFLKAIGSAIVFYVSLLLSVLIFGI
jgi:hypothetical protein